MTSCASYSINSPQPSYDDTLHPSVIALSQAIGGPILAVDTAGSETSVCLVHGAKNLVIERTAQGRALPCETLVQNIGDALHQAGLQVADLTALVASMGPGSFTGLRIGLATLQGLAMGAEIRMYGVSSLAVLAAGAGPGLVSPICDARRGDVFAALYEVTAEGLAQAVVPDNVFSRQDWAEQLKTTLPNTRLVGDAAADFASQVQRPSEAAPRRALLAVVQAATAIHQGDATAPQAMLPRYLRLSEPERQRGLAPKVSVPASAVPA